MIVAPLLAALLAAGTNPVRCSPTTLPAGLAVNLETVGPLSSKTSAKGDIVPLRTAEDVQVDGHIVIARGTEATGQISDARATGGLGVGGHLAIRPLYLKLDSTIVRLTGATSENGGAPAGTIVGLVLLTPVISGRSATIPAGSSIPAIVQKPVTLPARSEAAAVPADGC